MSVWVVSRHSVDWECPEIMGVFSTQEEAEVYADEHLQEHEVWDVARFEVDKWSDVTHIPT